MVNNIDLANMYFGLQVKVYYQEANPTTHYTDSRVRAREHERQELITGPKYNAVDK